MSLYLPTKSNTSTSPCCLPPVAPPAPPPPPPAALGAPAARQILARLRADAGARTARLLRIISLSDASPRPRPLPPLHSARQQLDRYSRGFVQTRALALHAFLECVLKKHPVTIYLLNPTRPRGASPLCPPPPPAALGAPAARQILARLRAGARARTARLLSVLKNHPVTIYPLNPTQARPRGASHLWLAPPPPPPAALGVPAARQILARLRTDARARTTRLLSFLKKHPVTIYLLNPTRPRPRGASPVWPPRRPLPLPPLHSARQQLDRYSRGFVQARALALHAFLDRVAKHPILTHSEDFRIFLTTPDEEIDKVFKSENSAMNLWGLSAALWDSGSSEAKPVNGARVKDPEFSAASDYLQSLQHKLTALCALTTKLYKGSAALATEYKGMTNACSTWASSERSSVSLALTSAARGAGGAA
ncbi:unnamed protein product [Plutella xylostella]|uniref:(diamondback moth) hypothetical protein n=1 Tax=Plutella xylostella TaxID=51655 RepID=A0A8S4DXT9_PLUXY|nr:unnamed protein product [Plutella xylostella]